MDSKEREIRQAVRQRFVRRGDMMGHFPTSYEALLSMADNKVMISGISYDEGARLSLGYAVENAAVDRWRKEGK